MTACQVERAAPPSAEPAPDPSVTAPPLVFETPPPPRLAGITTAEAFAAFTDEGLERWRGEVPGVRELRVRSTLDGREEPTLYLPPSGDGPQPLLVVLHSWSSTYRQHLGIPFARWAAERGWGVLHPNFRGVFETPEAAGSDVALRDVLDAVDAARERGGVDPDRVYLVGFSGGGMMALALAGRYPERWAGVAAWVPVHDLNDWYAHHRAEPSEADYARQIAAVCGGSPAEDAAAEAECRRRSPSAHLEAARRAGVPVYLGVGLADAVVPPAHGLRAFNQLAEPADRLAEDVLRAAARGRLPEALRGRLEAPTFFAEGDPPVLFSRRSGAATLVVFDGGHDLVYHPALLWMEHVGPRRLAERQRT